MAKGDTRSSRPSGGGGGGSHSSYDDEGRGTSKSLYEEFEYFFENSGHSEDWLMGTNVKDADPTAHRMFANRSLLIEGLYDGRLYRYVQDMTWRYNIHDWASQKFQDDDRNDGRVRRIVVKKLGVEVWKKFQARAKDVYEHIREEDRKKAEAQRDSYGEQQATYKAEQIKRQKEEVRVIMKDVTLIKGALQADFHQAFSLDEIYAQREGDWLDDPIEGVRTGYGFGEEIRRPSGIKLQITVSLDQSNSMRHNRVHLAAAKSFRDIYLALEQLQDEHPNDMFISAFTFSNDGWGSSDRGRRAHNLTVTGWSEKKIIRSTETSLGAVNSYRDTDMYNHFAGEDTWFYTLFEAIEEWENGYGDPGAIKLDIILTDAVIEHPSDIRRSDKIQERRNGNLQTIMLNFMHESEWVNSDLPLHCVQYAASPVNIGGMLRNLLTEFVSVYL
jgi:hypothetical protein